MHIRQVLLPDYLKGLFLCKRKLQLIFFFFFVGELNVKPGLSAHKGICSSDDFISFYILAFKFQEKPYSAFSVP